jgi:hypothetical protein
MGVGIDVNLPFKVTKLPSVNFIYVFNVKSNKWCRSDCFLEAEKGRGPLQSVQAGRLLYNENVVNARERNIVKGATQGATLLKPHLRAWGSAS